MEKPEHKHPLNPLLENLASQKTLEAAEGVISNVLAMLGMKPKEKLLLSLPRINAEVSRFERAPGFESNPAAYEIPTDKEEIFDVKLFWMKKTTKTNLSWLVGLTTNFEDADAYDYKNIGINFVIPHTCDRIIILLSHRYKIRSLELKERITKTQSEIFSDWINTDVNIDGDKKDVKAKIHQNLWGSFNFEPISQRFYLELVKHFNILVSHLEPIFKKRPSVMFTTRLIGRVLFIWFLRKKNLINPNIDYFIVDDPHKQCEYYRNKLEKLLFGTLNTEIAIRKDRDPITPYLNGGLFDKYETDFIDDNNLSFPNSFFDDMYNTLNKYNFTVDESSSEFQHVAIDPEMLGRIFESFLAEQIDETSNNNKRRATGAFYTPREIVNFMCEQAIIEFLKDKLPDTPNRDRRIEELIRLPETLFRDQDQNKRRDWKPFASQIINLLDGNGTIPLTILDPAVGSGAFPMGMLQVLTKIYSRLNPKLEKNTFDLKRTILSKSIYGVDIEPTAIEICRLRAWLSIIVDAPETTEIDPLPNLDFKFACANTLIRLDNQKQSGLFDDQQLKDKLIEIRHKYFNTSEKSKKNSLQTQYEELTQQQVLGESTLSKQLKSYKPFDVSTSSDFYDPEIHHGIESFDIVIGNPPYIRESTNRNAFDGIRDSSYYQGRMDLWYMFASQGIDLLTSNSGILTFIATNNWVTNEGASKIRNKIIESTEVLKLIDFGDYMIFDTASIQTMIMLFRKRKMAKKYQFDYRRLSNGTQNDVVNLLNNVTSENTIYIDAFIDPIKDLNQPLYFNETHENTLLNKIKSKANFVLDPIAEIANGIVAPQDILNKKNAKRLGAGHQPGEGVFVITKQELEKLTLDNNELGLIKPCYTTNELDQWYKTKENSLWLIYTDSRFKNPSEMAPYPNIKRHLNKYLEIITSQNKPYGLSRSRVEAFFVGEKIVSLRKTAKPCFTYSNNDCYVMQTFNVIKTNKVDLKFLTGLLNSKVIHYWLKLRGKKQGENLQIDIEPILRIPICVPDDVTPYVTLVDQIIEHKKANKKTSALEDSLDELFFQLYDLEPSEIEEINQSLA